MPTKPTIIIAGLGRTGEALARRLSDRLPVVVVEVDPAVTEGFGQGTPPGSAENLRVVTGDATSALVLKRTGIKSLLAAIACTGSEESNLEMLRRAKETFDVPKRIALMVDPELRDRYENEGIVVVDRAVACAAELEGLLEDGRRGATGLGHRQGEIIEVEVLARSFVVGKELAKLHPRRWHVAAVYRDGQLIVPHGDTVLQAGDRVLVVGEPEVLPSVAELIRTGDPEFPLQYGTHVVAICGQDVSRLLDEVAYLVKRTHADKFEVIACDLEEDEMEPLVAQCEEAGISFEFSCRAETTDASLLEEAQRRDVGVLILAPEKMSFRARIGLGRTRTARIVDMLDSPVMVARGSFPYRRVLLVLAEVSFHQAAAQLAIDLVRMLDAEVTLGVVHQPELVVGSEIRGEVDERRRLVEKLAGMHHVALESRVFQGNPIEEVMRAAGDYDLVILPYKRRRKSFLTRPDVALNLIHRLGCSVMVMPHD